MAFDAVVLSGGRASRLGGAAKATLVIGGSPLVVRAVTAAAEARVIVVVGDGAPGLPAGIHLTREVPAFGGPVAALGAGLSELARHGDLADLLLILACDMPNASAAVEPLHAAAESTPLVDGVLAIDEGGQRQYLAAVYRTRALIAELSKHPTLAGLSMRSLVGGLRLAEIAVPPGATHDVDSWTDAAQYGIAAPTNDPHQDVSAARDDDQGEP